jgi:ribose-phosphate pyrophosphokinase
MIKLDNKVIDINHFPDGTILLKETVSGKAFEENVNIEWKFENNEELLALFFLTNHIKNAGYNNIILNMPYIPNARQDRVKNPEDVFTLKYFAQLINSLGFKEVRVLDAHSNVSLALLDRVVLESPKPYIEKVIDIIEGTTGRKPLMFYPDEGAGKRYSGMITLPYCFGIKKRDWATGEIKGLSVTGETELIKGSDVLIVDDICSYGGTFLHSANALKELGAADIYLFVSHCEKSILDGKLYGNDNLKHIYTTDSIFNLEDERITVFKIND